MGVGSEDEEDSRNAEESGERNRNDPGEGVRTHQCAQVPGMLRPLDFPRLHGRAAGCGRVVLGEAGGLTCQCWAFPDGSMGESGDGSQEEVFSGAGGIPW